MNNVYIISAKRTPIGSFGGSLSGISATSLGSDSIKAALDAIGIDPNHVNEVFYGNVCQANLGQAPARQAALGAGLPNSVITTTINKVCASGMKSIVFGAQSIELGINDVVVAGGMESMSNIPFYLPTQRWGHKYGNTSVIDGLSRDGLTDVYDEKAMGVFADATAEKFGVSREAQDQFAINSYKKVAQATLDGKLKDEISPILIPQRKGDPIVFSEDEEYKNVNFDKIPALRPAFTPNGTVTAANASTINDGAATIILASEKFVRENNIKPLARIVSYADAEHEPNWFTTAPTKAAPIALERAGLSIDDIDFFEVNEAFSIVPLVFAQELNIPLEKINVYGGGVALGHPLGCSGARIVVTLNNILHQEKGKYGLAAICNGGGGASAMVIERL